MQAMGDMLQELRICRIRSVADVNVCLDVMGKKLVRAEGVGAHIRIALGAQNRLHRYKGYSVPETPSYGTELCVGNSLL